VPFTNACRDVIADGYFGNPTFCSVYNQELEDEKKDPARFWGSAEAGRMNDTTKGVFFDWKSGAYELGYDGAQVFNFCKHTTGFIFIRPLNIPERMRSQHQFTRLLAIIPGPREPSNIDPYIAPIVMDLKRHGPQSGGKLPCNS
jgi:hypothetical protein